MSFLIMSHSLNVSLLINDLLIATLLTDVNSYIFLLVHNAVNTSSLYDISVG